MWRVGRPGAGEAQPGSAQVQFGVKAQFVQESCCAGKTGSESQFSAEEN